MNDNEKKRQAAYDEAVIQIVQHYGLACEGFGRASEGSPRGMENMMRIAREAAIVILGAALGRDPTLAELEQIPPLYERPVVSLSLDQLSVEPRKRKPRTSLKH